MLDRNKFYFVVARHSNKALDVTDRSNENGALIQQWNYESRRPNKQFLFAPLDDGYYYIVARHSAKGLDVRDASTADGALIQQWDTKSGRPNKQFRLVPAGSDYYYIVARHSGKAFDVVNRGTQDGAFIQQWSYESGRQNKHFRFEVADTAPVPTLAGTHHPAHDIGDVDRLTGFRQPPESTRPVLVGETLIPFLLVEDGVKEQQVENNPYYKLSRYGYWKRVFYYDHAGAEYTHEVETVVGLTKTTATTIRRTVALTIGADRGFKLDPISILLKVQITGELQVTESTSETVMEQKKVTVTRRWPAGVRLAQTVWFRADEYVLTRIDGSVVIRWEVVRDDELVSDAYPQLSL